MYRFSQEEINRMAGHHVEIEKLSKALHRMGIPVKCDDRWRDKSRCYIEFQSTEEKWREELEHALSECSLQFFH